MLRCHCLLPMDLEGSHCISNLATAFCGLDRIQLGRRYCFYDPSWRLLQGMGSHQDEPRSI
jgi:hypothetical protein